MAITISGENNNDRILASDGVIDSLSGFNVVGVMTATSFTGDLTGDVTGNLTGNVTGNINNSTLLLQTGGTERLRILSDGKVGIGTNNPETLLEVQGSTPVLRVTGASATPARLDLTSTGVVKWSLLSNDVSSALSIEKDDSIKFVIDTSGKVGIGTDNPNATGLTVYRDDTGLGNIVNIEQDGTGDAVLGFAIKGTAAWQFGIDNSDGDKFKISYDGSGLDSSTSVTLDRNGKVGIGTDDPYHNLHVYQDAGDAVVTIESTGDGNDSALEFYRTSSGGNSMGAGSIYVTGNTSASEAIMHFGVGHNISHGTVPRLSIKGDGEVGIGTENPSTMLHIKSTFPTLLVEGTNDTVGHTVSKVEVRAFHYRKAGFTISGDDGTEDIFIGRPYGSGNTTAPLVFNFQGNEKLRITSTGQLNLAGNMQFTAANPEIELNNGGPRFRVPAANTLAVHSGGTLGSTNDEQLRITSGGVGIGTVTIASGRKLEVCDGIISVQAGHTHDTRIEFYRKNTGSRGWIGIPNWDPDGLYIFGPTSNSNEIAAKYSSGDWNFFTSGSSNSEKLRITSNGDVRIGGGAPTTFGSGTTVHETYNASTFTANLVVSGTHVLQMLASQTHGVTSIGTRSNHNLNLCVNDSTKLTIDTNGNVTKPTNPAFFARPPEGYSMSGDTIIGGTWSTSDSEAFVRGTLSNGTSIWDNSTGIFTVPVTGIYYIHWNVFLKSNTTRRDAMIYRNGTGSNKIIARTEIGEPSGTSGSNKNVAVTAVVSLSVNDTIRFGALTTGGTQIYQSNKPWSYACAYLVG